MRKKSTYVILLIILLAFLLVMLLIFGRGRIGRDKLSATFLVGDNTVWTYRQQGWNNITSYASLKDLNWKDYTVYLDNKKIGNYSLWHDDKWYAFDKKKNAVSLEGKFLAYNANYDVDVYSYQEEDINDRTYVDIVLEQNGISTTTNFTSASKVDIDFDQDGIVEEFYLVSNVFDLVNHPDVVFSIVFMVKDNKIYSIYNDVSANHSFNGCKPFFQAFLDTNDDKVSELILSCGRYSISEQVDMLYQFQDNEFKIVISNQ